MLAIINSCAFLGVNGYLVKVEVDVGAGLPAFDIVGLPDTAVKESRERVRAAIKNSGYEFPLRRITVNLAPANIKKEGAIFDLPIAIAILAATEQVTNVEEKLKTAAIVGELSLDGAVRPISGALVMSDCLGQTEGVNHFYLPVENAMEAAIVDKVDVFGVSSLRNLCEVLEDTEQILPVKVDIAELLRAEGTSDTYDMSDVKGQEGVKRALEIAAAGGHNVLLIGPPGSGKTMLARRLPGILPPMTLGESLEVTKLYSISGLLPKSTPLVKARPFRSPHHGASSASIIGGGATPKPGEISLASHGVLFMDEMPEFNRDVLEALRQPLEDRTVIVSRVRGRVEYPAGFQLVGALNPCPCGYYGDMQKQCSCTPHMIDRYLSRISGPLMDRVDLQIEVPRVKYSDLSDQRDGDSSQVIRSRVIAAREIQAKRFEGIPVNCNAQMGHREVQNYCGLDKDGDTLMKMAFSKLHLSARAHDRILKVARTIADLYNSADITASHIAEAIQYRNMDRNNRQ